jgi:hypothetical protein
MYGLHEALHFSQFVLYCLHFFFRLDPYDRFGLCRLLFGFGPRCFGFKMGKFVDYKFELLLLHVVLAADMGSGSFP